MCQSMAQSAQRKILTSRAVVTRQQVLQVHHFIISTVAVAMCVMAD